MMKSIERVKSIETPINSMFTTKKYSLPVVMQPAPIVIDKHATASLVDSAGMSGKKKQGNRYQFRIRRPRELIVL